MKYLRMVRREKTWFWVFDRKYPEWSFYVWEYRLFGMKRAERVVKMTYLTKTFS